MLKLCMFEKVYNSVLIVTVSALSTSSALHAEAVQKLNFEKNNSKSTSLSLFNVNSQGAHLNLHQFDYYKITRFKFH